MRFVMVVDYANRGEGNDPEPLKSAWREEMNVAEVTNEQEAQAYSERIIQNFNDTLRPKERPRKLIRVEFGEGEASERHDWEKTNLVTQRDARGQFDSYKCRKCGITGKRRSFDGGVAPDPAYRAKAFQSCDTARERLRIRREQSTKG